MKPKFYTLWRSISVVLIGLMFIGPWYLNPGSTIPFNEQPLSGWQVIWNFSFGIVYSIVSDFIPNIDWIILIPFLLIAFGGIGAAVYMVCSISLLIFKDKTFLYRYARPLLICSSPILLVALELIVGIENKLLWGYWVGIAGLFSSFILEWSIRKSRLSDTS